MERQHKAELKKQQAAEKKAAEDKLPESAAGLISAVQEWAKALLGVSRLSTSPSSSQASAQALLDHHLPSEPTSPEVNAWSSFLKSRSDSISNSVETKMAEHVRLNPNLSDSAKNLLRTTATKEAVQSYKVTNPRLAFISRLAHSSSLIVTYPATHLKLAEASFYASGFPRITFQWSKPLSNPWNMAALDLMVTTWLECYNARGVPSTFVIDHNHPHAEYAKSILNQWILNKRSVWSQQEKDKKLIASGSGIEKIIERRMTQKEKRAMKTMKDKVSIILSHSSFIFTFLTELVSEAA